MLIPQIQGERPPTQIIMAKLIKANTYLKQSLKNILVHRMSLPKGRVHEEGKCFSISEVGGFQSSELAGK